MVFACRFGERLATRRFDRGAQALGIVDGDRESLMCRGSPSGRSRRAGAVKCTETGRPVVNDIHASFRFEDGLIAEHRDEFNFHRWARQALGPVGLLLGWTPIVRGAVRRKAAARLDEFTRASGN